MHHLVTADDRQPATPRSHVIADLVTRAQRGDHSAFEQLCSVTVDRLYGTATLILHDTEAAKDAVQETLIEAWRNLPTLREPDAYQGWLRRILVRKCYRQIRHRRRRSMEVQVLEIDAPTESPELGLDAIDQIERAFRRLTHDQRAVLVLHHRVGLQLTEAADVLGVPVGTVKSRLNRATAALRAALDAENRQTALMKGHTA